MFLETLSSLSYASFVLTTELLLLIWNYKLIKQRELTAVSLNLFAALLIWTTIVIRNLTAATYAVTTGEPIFSPDDWHFWLEIIVRGLIRIPFYISGVLILITVQRLLADHSQCGKGIYWTCWFGLASFGLWILLVLTGNGKLV